MVITDRVSLLFQLCLRLEPNDRPSCSDLLKHVCFTHDDFHSKFTIELRDKVIKEMEANPLLKGLGVTIHGSAHEYLQQLAEAQGVDRTHSEKDLGREEEEVARKEKIKRGERKKYGTKPKRKVGVGGVEGVGVLVDSVSVYPCVVCVYGLSESNYACGQPFFCASAMLLGV